VARRGPGAYEPVCAAPDELNAGNRHEPNDMNRIVRLFVYGTLRSDAQHGTSASTLAFNALKSGAVREGLAWVRGGLFAVDWYPAYVDTVPGKVKGEVWRIHQPSVIRRLNGYEGGDYLRELVRAVLENGRKVTAWAYKYRLPLRGVPRIDSGDYLDWMRSAKAPPQQSSGK
jgi:gamma-glutamylcyclotransferase (GGCT)/AIG2-like uncharacterized protein YtfP